MLLFNMFSNKLDNFINISNEENIINQCQNRNLTNPRLLSIGRNKVTSYFERREEIKGVNGDMSEVSFLDQGIIKYN